MSSKPSGDRLTARDIADRSAIEEVLVRYARALDEHDFELLSTCFTDQARAQFGGVVVDGGSAAIVEFLRRAAQGARMHLISNLSIKLSAGVAEVASSAVTFSVIPGSASGTPLQVRGVHYRDRMAREGGEWRIAERIHSAVWQSEIPHQVPSPIVLWTT